MSFAATSSIPITKVVRIVFSAILLLGIIANPMDRSQAAPDDTLTVCSIGCSHTSIQAAVGAAFSGDTIQILTSTPHTEYDIVVNKDITIEGAGNDTSTIVQAAATQPAATNRVFFIASGTTAIIQNLTVQHGNSTHGAGINNGGTLTLINVNVEDNQENGIYNTGVLTVTNSIIQLNRATSGSYSYGGGIYNAAGITTLINTCISSNTANPRGGGIYNDGSLRIENSLINSNKVEKNAGQDSRGGGISNQGDLTIFDSTIQGNQVKNSNTLSAFGGGIYSSNSTLTITNTIIEKNFGSEVDNNLLGGGLLISGGEVEITNSTISGNYQISNGGGLYIINAPVNIDNSTIDNNTVDESGGGIIVLGEQVNLLNTTIISNTAVKNGGGIYIESTGIANITNTTIAENTTLSYGGGIYANGTLTITGSTINKNSTHTDGGGIYIMDGSGELTNSTVSSNYAQDSGAGLYFDLQGSKPVYLNNLTLTRNRARTDNLSGVGGGIYIDSASSQPVYVKNSILANNFRGNVLPTVYEDCYGVLHSLDYNLIQSTDNCTINGDIDHNQPPGVDPLLELLGDYGGPTQTHMPQAGSPVIDQANPDGCEDSAGATLVTDQRGNPRSVDGDGDAVSRCDIGAVEYAINPIPAITILNPASTEAGGEDFTLTVTGSDFVDVAVVQWKGTARNTTFVSDTQLSAQVNAADIAGQGSASITVLNPEPGGGVSNALEFTITPPIIPPPAEDEEIYIPIVVR
jgi:predicted outer membrane repeat protein